MNKESIRSMQELVLKRFKEDFIFVANQYAECNNYDDAVCILQQTDGEELENGKSKSN